MLNMVNTSPTQMEQVLLNLCVNAAHAMTTMRGIDDHQGGRLTVTLKKGPASAWPWHTTSSASTPVLLTCIPSQAKAPHLISIFRS